MIGKASLLVLGLLLSFNALQVQAQLDVNLLSLFSLTREEEGSRFTDDSDLFAFVHAFALANRLTDITANQLNEEVEILPGLTKTFTCDVNYNLLLQDTQGDFSNALQDVSNLNLNEFDLIIGPSRSSVCVPVSFIASTFELPVFSPSCTSPELDDTIAHRFFGRTIPSDDVTALAMIELLVELPKGIRQPALNEFSAASSAVYSRVAVLYVEDTYGSNFKDSLFENALEKGFDIEFTFIPFTTGNENSIRASVQTIAETNLNVILGLFFTDDIRIAVDEARNQGIFTEEQVWIFSDGILSAVELKDGLGIGIDGDAPREVLEIVNNSFLVQASGQVDADLVEGFQSQAFQSEFGYNLADIRRALEDQEGADNGIFENVLQQMEEHANGVERVALTDFSLFAFDLILGIQEYLEGNCNPINGSDFINALPGLSYTGVTGAVSFDSSQSRENNNAAFRLLNARFDDENNPVDVEVGFFDGTRWEIYDDLIRFNSGRQQAPLVVDPPLNVELNPIPPEIRGVLYVLTSIVLVAAFILGYFTQKYSGKQVIRAAQPVFLFLTLLGVVVSTTSVYVFPQEQDSGKVSLFKCNVPYFLISLGLTISYGSLVFKLERVVEIAKETTDLVYRNHENNNKTFRKLILLFFIDLAIFIITFTVVPLELERRVVEVDDFDQPIEVFDICSPRGNDSGGLYSLYFIFHVLLYTYGFRLILKVRNLPTDFQEGKWITISVLSQHQLYLLGIPVVIAVGVEDPGVRFLVIGLLVLFSNVILMALIFGPKFLRIINGDDKVTWQTSNYGKIISQPSDLYEVADGQADVTESYRRSLMNTMDTADFGNLD